MSLQYNCTLNLLFRCSVCTAAGPHHCWILHDVHTFEVGKSLFFTLESFISIYFRWARIGYASAGALIFSFYIIYDTQMMMGGAHKYSVSPEEYIFAALNLYLDIINLFMYILMIFGSSKN